MVIRNVGENGLKYFQMSIKLSGKCEFACMEYEVLNIIRGKGFPFVCEVGFDFRIKCHIVVYTIINL